MRALMEIEALVGERGAYRLAKPSDAVSRSRRRSRRSSRPGSTGCRPRTSGCSRRPRSSARTCRSPLLQAIADCRRTRLRRGPRAPPGRRVPLRGQPLPRPRVHVQDALTHEVAYGGLLQERRRVLHAAIVTAIERLYADRLAEHVERLAHHAVRGQALAKAVPYLRQAGRRPPLARRIGEAIALFEQALAIVEPLPQTAATMREALDIRIALGPALIAVKGAGTPEVEALYRQRRTRSTASGTVASGFLRCGVSGTSTTPAGDTPRRSKRGSVCSRPRRPAMTPASSSRRTTRFGRPCRRWANRPWPSCIWSVDSPSTTATGTPRRLSSTGVTIRAPAAAITSPSPTGCSALPIAPSPRCTTPCASRRS